MEQSQGLIRASAHARLTATAQRLRRPGMSMADAFELACLRAPDEQRWLRVDLDDREGQGRDPDRHATNRVEDGLATRVRAHVRGDHGRIDPAKLKRFAKANGCWRDKYETMSLGSQMSGVLGRLRALAGQGQDLLFP